MTSRSARPIAIPLFAALVTTCGAPPPPKSEPTPADIPSEPATVHVSAAGAPSSLAEVPNAKPTNSASDGAETTAGTAVPEEAPPPAAPEPKFQPIDVMTGPEMAYIVDYVNSGAKEHAKKACANVAEGEESKVAECLSKAREKFGADVMRFRKDERGRYRWVIYRRNGSALVEIFNGQVELTERSPNVVRVDIKGGTGQRPIAKDKTSFDLKVPNGYSLEIEDTVYGRLPYDAKVGFVAK